MNVLSPRVHGVLDYVTVVFFIVAPALFGLEGLPAIISYVLAAVHLLMTALTAFPLGLADVIPFRVHGTVELIVAVVLFFGAWLLGEPFTGGAQTFYMIVGVAIFLVWLLTNYQSTAPTATRRV